MKIATWTWASIAAFSLIINLMCQCITFHPTAIHAGAIVFGVSLGLFLFSLAMIVFTHIRRKQPPSPLTSKNG